jgi:simple sugar transport system ATP-binding protein
MDANDFPPVLSGCGLWKNFGASVSLSGVSIDLHPKRILALLGDNGAGKSTLVKILSGVLHPDKGEMLLNGRPIRFRSPLEARKWGISTVFQDLAICPLLSVVRNFILGNEPTKGWGPFRRYDRRRARSDTASALASLGVQLKGELDDPISTLSGGERQAVAIARGVFYGSRCLILDEPTSALAVRQAEKVLNLIRKAAEGGQSVLLVTHNIRHALSIADDIMVLAHGSTAGLFKKGEIDADSLIDLVAQQGTGASGEISSCETQAGRRSSICESA